MDDDRATVVHGEEIVCGPDIVFVKTMNVGYEYVGTFTVDKAQLNRNDIYMEVGPMPPQHETALLMQRANVKKEVASKIVHTMFDLRRIAQAEELDVDITTRSSLKVAHLCAAGMTMRQAFEFAIVIASQTNRKGLVDRLNSQIGALEEGYTSTF
jgi:MoxR-like ATPase